MKIICKELILYFLISAFIITPSFAENKSIANTSSSKSSSGVANTGEESSSGATSSTSTETFDKDLCEKIGDVNKKNKETAKENVDKSIKPIEGSVTGFSCTDDLWSDITNLGSSILDLIPTIDELTGAACDVAQGGMDALTDLAGVALKGMIKTAVATLIAESGLEEPLEMLEDTDKYLGTAENSTKTENLVKTAGKETKREYEDVLYNTDTESNAKDRLENDLTY